MEYFLFGILPLIGALACFGASMVCLAKQFDWVQWTAGSFNLILCLLSISTLFPMVFSGAWPTIFPYLLLGIIAFLTAFQIYRVRSE